MAGNALRVAPVSGLQSLKTGVAARNRLFHKEINMTNGTTHIAVTVREFIALMLEQDMDAVVTIWDHDLNDSVSRFWIEKSKYNGGSAVRIVSD